MGNGAPEGILIPLFVLRTSEMREFYEFIKEDNLVNMPCKGTLSAGTTVTESLNRLDYFFSVWCFDRKMGHNWSIDR